MPRLFALGLSAGLGLWIVLACGPAQLAGAAAAPTPTALARPTSPPTRAAVATSQPTATGAPLRATAVPPTPVAATPTPTPLPTLIAVPPTVVAQDAPELRAVWVDAFHDGFKTPEQVDELVAWARRANVNALFVQVRRRGDAYYLKSFEPRTEDPDLRPGFDALQYLIDRAHGGPQRLEVHAWLATLPIWNKHTPPGDPRHVFNQHVDDWLMLRDDGEAWAATADGGMYYLDPGNPDAARYTTDVYLNVLRNYDVDGVHLDQVRYFEGDPRHWGYNRTSVARFNQQFGRDPDSQPDANDPDWIAWRRDQVTALVRRIYLEAKAIKPNVAVTAAVVAWGSGPQSNGGWEHTAPFASVFQDWRYWLQEGFLDYALPMDYYRESEPQNGWFDAWADYQTANRGKRGVAIGVGNFLNSMDSSLAQIARARALNPLGVALYSYAVPARGLDESSPSDRDAFADRLHELFPRPARPPALTSLGGSLAIEVPGREGLSVTVADGAGNTRQWSTDGTGLAGGVDLPPGRYTISITAPDVDPTPFQANVTAGSTTLIQLAPGAPAS
jgi:uncharacterized lipoprotein YddW (UPF0748 family)